MKITARFYLIFLAAAIVLTGSYHYSFLMIQENSIKQSLTEDTARLEKSFSFFTQSTVEEMDLVSGALSSNPTAMALFKEEKREDLYREILPLFEELKNRLRITHLFFIRPDGTIFLRMHKKDSYDDKVLHGVFQAAEKTQSSAMGFGLGKIAFALRLVRPILIKGKLFGYIELSIPADELLKRLKSLTSQDYLLFYQRNYITTENWLLLKQSLESLNLGRVLGNQLFLSSSFPLNQSDFFFPPETETLLDKGGILYFKQGKQYLALGSFPLWDSHKTRVGTVLIPFNLTQTMHQTQSFFFICLWSFLALFLVVSAVYFFFGRLMSKNTRAMKDALGKMSRGEFDFSLTGLRHDELGELASLIRQTSQAFQTQLQENRNYVKRLENESASRTKELILTRSELEKKVQERTAELTKSQTAMLYMIEDLNRQAEEIRRTQEKMVRSEKLAAIGQLSSSVAHELRNPLGVMKNAVYYLNMLELGKENSDIQQNLNILSQEIENSNKIIGDLLEFSRIKAPTLRPENLHEILEETLKRIPPPPLIRIETFWDSSVPEIWVDQLQLQQVFYNLILNAFQAMEDGGVLKIITEKKEEEVTILFIDSGSGISQDMIGKIFDPLFTTKAKGTGLGLPVCVSLIQGHKGKIEVESTLGKGTTFSVKLPFLTGKKDKL